MRGAPPPKAFPLGGRWLAEGQTDEGAMIGLFRSSQEEFLRCDGEQGSALRGGFLFRVEKEPKDARGSAQDGHSVSIFAAPLEPPLRGTLSC